MATHSSVLAWRILWTEEPCDLQSMGSQRVRYDKRLIHKRVKCQSYHQQQQKKDKCEVMDVLNIHWEKLFHNIYVY